MLIYQLPGNFETRELHLDLLWQAGASGLEERGAYIRAYFEKRVDLPSEIIDGEWHEEADQDWQAEFKRNLQPVQAGNVHIIAPWHPRPTNGLVLSIEPKMAFGTGHHATTRMAIEALQEQPLSNCRVLDVGTGSGVLAMTAHMLGAHFAYGIDIDPITIPIAKENAELNRLQSPSPQLQFDEGTLTNDPNDPTELPLEPLKQPFDLIVANLYAELHDTLADAYVKHLKSTGRVILTGILTSKLELVQRALERHGFEQITKRTDGEWALVTAHKTEKQEP